MLISENDRWFRQSKMAPVNVVLASRQTGKTTQAVDLMERTTLRPQDVLYLTNSYAMIRHVKKMMHPEAAARYTLSMHSFNSLQRLMGLSPKLIIVDNAETASNELLTLVFRLRAWVDGQLVLMGGVGDRDGIYSDPKTGIWHNAGSLWFRICVAAGATVDYCPYFEPNQSPIYSGLWSGKRVEAPQELTMHMRAMVGAREFSRFNLRFVEAYDAQFLDDNIEWSETELSRARKFEALVRQHGHHPSPRLFDRIRETQEAINERRLFAREQERLRQEVAQIEAHTEYLRILNERKMNDDRD